MHVIQYCQLGGFFGNLWAAFDNFSFTVFTSAVIYYCVLCLSAETSPRTCQHVPISCICDMSSTCVAISL